MSKRTKPVRYWPGKAPVNAPAASDSDSDDENDTASKIVPTKSAQRVNEHEGGDLIPVTEISEEIAQQDRRLRRLLSKKRDGGEDDDEEGKEEDDGRGSRRAAEEDKKEGSEDEDDEEAQMRRRDEIRRRALSKMQEEENVEKDVPDNEESQEESESEYTDESDEEEDVAPVLLKPTFVPKAMRDTILEQERVAAEAKEAEERRLKLLEERKRESHILVADVLMREVAEAQVATGGALEVDDTDGLNEEEEYEAWKLRELKRIKRDKEIKEQYEREQAEIERRRNMTDSELKAEAIAKQKEREENPRGNQKYLQRYYHKGAFYQEEEILKERDFSAPTLEDRFDKMILPEVMQVKNFGRQGRTKWTHLTKEDTSSRDSPWFDKKNDVIKRNVSKLGGFKDSFDKPTKRRRV
ncbi:splicing factor, Prp19-binding domain-containing protein [Cladochytrium replicatum]|nr:splicing factor, Prp19-binding domain-containing protein [Cladochytrium replicatum]